ncbi:MAG TPA: adenylate/guanylate cyclase domain-containing protein, partial [Rhodopila sp.]|nr:adenylate/guanylate cyclase domain-containing protein [Rhodopila sp.]
MSTPEDPGHGLPRRQTPGLAPLEEATLTVQERMHGSESECHGAAERRQLSIMFCDVADFTALSSRLDPEDLSAVIREYQLRVAAAVAGFGGFIARYVGDGVLIYFGWPAAHEANAEQAVRAALAIIEAVSRTPVRTESLQVRIGIATGVVVIGDPIGTGWARQQTAIGEAPNLAARLQALAGPNGVIIDAASRRQIGALFTCRDLGPVTLKGMPNAVPAWQVTGPAAFSSRSESVHAATAPLLAREDELALMLRAWAQASSGSGQVVLLSGEPGIGKSRLAACLMEHLAHQPHTALRYFCS